MLRKNLRSFQATTISFLVSFSKSSKAQNKSSSTQKYDLAIIGGGSGGLSAAFQASKHGLKVLIIDYVQPSPQGTKWGLGGTCVNVGCIPKKLMHHAAKYADHIMDANDYGLTLPGNLNERNNQKQLKKHFKWENLRAAITSYIKSLNFGYISTINQLQTVSYLNSMATFVDEHTLLCSKDPNIIRAYTKEGKISNDSQHQYIKAQNIIIATGTRPRLLKVNGEQLAITSDDIFFLKKPPNKTLVVGGGYVAVQIAGIVASLGYPVTMMTRGQYLREFDKDMVSQILNDLVKRQVNIVETSLPSSIKKKGQALQVVIKNQKNGKQQIDNFDTVLMAVGRIATTHLLNLDKIGVKLDKQMKIITKPQQLEKTQVESVYAIGDVVSGVPQLTGTVVKVGACLGRRLAQKMGKGKFSQNQKKISLENYPTTIFTPLQYSTCGLSQQQAIKKHKKENVEVYHLKFVPLQQNILQKYDENGNSQHTMAYMKAVIHVPDGKVIGLHYTGPNAGEIMQGFAAAVRVGITKDQLQSTIGIHPTIAQNFTDLNITKSSGKQFIKTSC